jgi:hypothetical protein
MGHAETRKRASDHPMFWAVWAIVAAFGTYFCMYGFRKPFTAAGFEGSQALGTDFKSLLVIAQVAGYTISKFVGIKVISEMKPAGRAAAILLLIGIRGMPWHSSSTACRWGWSSGWCWAFWRGGA